ncbi:MAG: peptidoglycan editing factor PgeF [Firmicutes bacterium]|nr:peptidoglycan editing factor PgeF [Bacillota bacterium]
MFTTRVGGVSTGDYKSLNLGIKTNDKLDNIKSNFKYVFDILNTSKDRLVSSDQVHSTNIEIITEPNTNNGIKNELNSNEIDGMLTNKPEITLFTYYADCVPLFYLDKNKKVVGLAHGGWKGTVNKIAGKMIDKMVDTYDSNPKDIIVGIAPSIGKCCYEVGQDVKNKFNENFTNLQDVLKSTAKGKWNLDLKKANMIVLKEKGILNRNIIISDLCTSCNNDLFFSYRKEKGITGRMGAFIKLKKNKEVL